MINFYFYCVKQGGIRMSKLLIVSSPSAAGKNCLLESLEDEKLVNQLISHTTRPKRITEESGREYYFVTDKEFDSINMVEVREYNTEHGLWKYGLSQSVLQKANDSKRNYLIIVDCEGKDTILKYIKDNNLNIKPITIFLNVSSQQRLLRSLNREGKMDTKAVDEVIRRYIDDNNKIIPHMSEYDIVLTNESMEDLERNVKIIKSLID